MRKRRRLANKMTIMVCAVLIAVSAFFYAPMEAHAAVNTFTDTVEVTETTVERMMFNMRSIDNSMSFPAVSALTVDKYYEINYSGVLGLTLNQAFNVNTQNLYMHFGGMSLSLFERENAKVFEANVRREFTFSGSFVYKAVSNPTFDYNFIMTISKNTSTAYDVTATHDFTFNIDSITEVSTSNANDYENGYNAGYSAGEDVGYDSGYSTGYNEGYSAGQSSDAYNEGFQAGVNSVDTDSYYNSGYDTGYDSGYEAGVDSVDTQSYYDAGYNAGYKVAYTLGYDVGYEEAYEIAYDAGYQKAYDEIAELGADITDYPKLVKTYSNSTGVEKWVLVNKDYVKEYDLNHNFASSDFGINPNHTYKFIVDVEGLDVFSNSECPCEWYGERFYMAVGSSKFIIRSSGNASVFFVPGYNMSSSFYLGCYIPNMIALSSTDYAHGEFCFAFDSYEISLYDMGPSGDTQNHIANQTDKLNENADKNTDKILNSWDSSKGDKVQSDLDTGLNEYQATENSLWVTATTGMKDFTFFDFESVPAMITGLSFVTSIMTRWFESAGGASGVGIVLSVLFSVMLVSMVLGLYRMYQSAGHRSEVKQRRESRKKGK